MSNELLTDPNETQVSDGHGLPESDILVGYYAYRCVQGLRRDETSLWRRLCGRCDGTGKVWAHWVFDGVCFKCNGSGFDTKAVTKKVVLKRAEAAAKGAAERAEIAAEQSKIAEAQFQAAKFDREWDEAIREDAQRARNSESKFLKGEIGSKVTIEGTIVFTKYISGQYGSSRLIIMETSAGKVKMFTSSAWAWEDRPADEVTEAQRQEGDYYLYRVGSDICVQATIKAFEEYKGEKSTLVTRAKLVP